MSVITVIWSMTAAVCLTLAGVHFFVWIHTRDKWESLLFCIAAVAAAALAMQEMALMRAQTPAETGELLRWMHVSVAAIIIAIVWFIRHHLKTGRPWLAWLISGLRVLVLVPNFVGYPNATFGEIRSLDHITFLGETVSVPVGDSNSWRFLIHAGTILLLIYVLDAAVSAWRQGTRERSLVLGAAILVAIVLGVTFSDLMVRGVLPGPLIAMAFMLIVLAMAFELSMDLIRVGRLSRSLLETQNRMNLAARAASLSLWEWDGARDEVWATDVGRERMAAFGPEHFSFERYLALVHPDDREFVRRAVRRTLDGETDFQAEFRLVGSDGRLQWIAAFGQLEPGEKGKSSRIRGVSMDVTEGKRVEAELQQKRYELVHIQRVSAMGHLSTALAHELNQPLGAILRNAEAGELILRQNPADLSELRDILSDIQQDDRRAAAVIERMRSLLKRQALKFEAIAVDELIEPVATLLRAETRSRHATLHIETTHGLPKVRGDRVQLQQVMLNLLLNSLDGLEAKQVGRQQVTVRARQTNDDTIELAVADSGAGIDPDHLPHLFEPFFTTKPKGTGVGLAISKTIIDAHGGRIWAENNPNGGATVHFTLPVAAPGRADE